jgi:hypothetical protein
LADRKVDIVGERREARDHARWAFGIVQNAVTEPARCQGGKERREPFDRHHCSVRIVDCGRERLQRDVDQLAHPEGRVLKQRALAAHEDCRNEVLSEPLGNTTGRNPPNSAGFIGGE